MIYVVILIVVLEVVTIGYLAFVADLLLQIRRATSDHYTEAKLQRDAEARAAARKDEQ